MKILKTSKGFTLVEILVAITAGGVIILSLNQVVTTYLHVSQRGRYLNLANSFIEAKVEELRNAGFNSVPGGTTTLTSSLPSQLPPNKSASMTVTSPHLGIKQLTLSVSFYSNGQNNTYQYTTYIGELGVAQ